MICAAFLLAGCTKQEPEEATGTPLTFGVQVEGYAGTRAATAEFSAADYFGVGGMGTATVYLADPAAYATYTYSAGKLAATDAFRFPLDGSAISTLTVDWPGIGKTGNDVAQDQRSLAAFLSSDWLRCTKADVNLSASVPLTLEHRNARLVFTITGPLAGAKIESLTVDGYTAYCDAADAVTDAQLMLTPGAYFSTTAMVTAKLKNDAGIYYFRVAGPMTLDAATSYTVELPSDNY